MRRLTGPVKKLLKTTGRVAIGIFEDGTVLIAGPEDRPLLLREGGVMEPVQYDQGGDGDIEFRFMKTTE